MPFDEYCCWKCGKTIISEDEPQARLFCDDCTVTFHTERKKTVSEYVKLKMRVMHERALRIMEKAGCYMHEYRYISDQILNDALKCPAKFRSSEEIVAAMVMSSNLYEYEMNHQVGRYYVDLYIPELFVCLEIDGDRHEHKADRDSERDIEIRKILGEKWEVVRITTNYLHKNPEKLVDAVEAVYKKKKELRMKNGGFLPENYSRQTKAHYKNAIVYNEKRIKT